MKAITPPLFALALAAGFSLPALAHDHDHGAMHAAESKEAALTEGMVKKVDKAAGRLTIAHGPLPNGMPAMTMAFNVKDKAMLDKVKEGDKVRFAAESANGAMTLVRLEAAK